jgi:hypothetical protein
MKFIYSEAVFDLAFMTSIGMIFPENRIPLFRIML